jgi:hypothetical protein
MGEVTRGLGKRGLSHSNAAVAMNDGCYTNGAAHDKMKSVSDDAGDVSRFVSLCISHAANNAGAEASFILLALFWSLIQKIFSQSDKAKQNWKDVTETSWKSYSETRWYSKYEVIESISFFFPDMLTVITKNVKDGISPRNSAKQQSFSTCFLMNARTCSFRLRWLPMSRHCLICGTCATIWREMALTCLSKLLVESKLLRRCIQMVR